MRPEIVVILAILAAVGIVDYLLLASASHTEEQAGKEFEDFEKERGKHEH